MRGLTMDEAPGGGAPEGASPGHAGGAGQNNAGH